MSLYIVVCPACGREIPSADEIRRTPQGREVCNGCAQESYVDVPLA